MAIDPCAVYRSAITRALPDAVIVVDHFHLVRLASQAVTRVRQRVTRQVLGRRGGAQIRSFGVSACRSEWIGPTGSRCAGACEHWASAQGAGTAGGCHHPWAFRRAIRAAQSLRRLC